MKTIRVLLIVVCGLALVTLLASGCGKVRQAAEVARVANDARDGKFTVTNEKGEKATVDATKTGDKEGKVTIETKEGTATSQTGADVVKSEDVGIDFFPDATVENSTATSMTGDKGGKYSVVILNSTASFDDVAKFYKDKYAKGNTVIEQPNNLMITIKAGENEGKMIMVATEEGKTRIMIHSTAAM